MVLSGDIWIRVLNSLVVALGDLCVLQLFFWALRVRHPQLRRAGWALAIVHSLAALLLISPMRFISVALVHDGTMREIAWAEGLDLVLLLGLGGVATALLAWRARRAVQAHRMLFALTRIASGHDPELSALLRSLAQRLDMPAPELLVLDGPATSPIVVGPGSPVLVFPRAALDTLDRQELEAVLTHELCHVKRRDLSVAVALELIRTLLWFNPLIGMLIRRYREEVEKLRDVEAARHTGGLRALASGILKISEQLTAPTHWPALCGSQPFTLHRSGQSARRLRHLVHAQHSSRWALVCQVLVLLALCPLDPQAKLNAVEVERKPRVANSRYHGRFTIALCYRSTPLQIEGSEDR